MTAPTITDQPKRWPIALIAVSAAVAVWSGWVGLGTMSGFGIVYPLPGIASGFHLNTAITLPIGMEAYGAYALGTWLRPAGIPARARSFARWSAVGALALGMLGQVAYHLLTAAHAHRAPWPVVVLVSCLPVAVLGFAATLAHLRHADERDAPPPVSGPVQSAAPEPVPGPVPDAITEGGPGPVLKALPGPVQQGGPRHRSSAPRTAGPKPRRTAPKAGSDADLANEARALNLLAADLEMTGADLARHLGVSESYGRKLRRRLTATVPEPGEGTS